MVVYIVQVWWGDGWSYGTRYSTRKAAEACAAELRKEGWKVRIV
jgi:hypothetical protein